MSAVQIETQRTILRRFRSSDVYDMFGCITPELTRYMSFDPPASLTALEEIGLMWRQSMDDGREIFLVARSRDDKRRFLGVIGVHNLAAAMPELGIWLRKEAQDQGYGREMLTTVIAWAIDRFKPQGFIYPVAEKNLRSSRLAEALGGVLTGARQDRKYHTVIYTIPAG